MLVELAPALPDCKAIDGVGGWVRDALLGLQPGQCPDLDVRVATDDIGALARGLVERFGGEARVTPDFPTARWTAPGGGRSLDLSAFRAEDYPRPGANPVVRRGTGSEDLARRDFSVNAMAYRLWPPQQPALIDPHGGRADLEARRLRILHPGAFADDPSRVIRAARYASRLGFTLDAGSRAALDTLLVPGSPPGRIGRTGSRIRSEWARLLMEPSPAAALRCLADWHAGVLIGLPSIEPEDPAVLRLTAALEGDLEPIARDPLQVLALLGGPSGCEAIIEWFEFSPEDAACLRRLAAARGRWGQDLAVVGLGDHPRLDRLGLDEQVSRIPLECRDQLRLGDADLDAALRTWEREVRALAPLLTGDDLLAAGWVPGPELGEALRQTRRAQLRGELTSRDHALDRLARGRADREA
jgi:tRNA nucleotidyltransferase/poly(A) polymerase